MHVGVYMCLCARVCLCQCVGVCVPALVRVWGHYIYVFTGVLACASVRVFCLLVYATFHDQTNYVIYNK